MVVTYHANQCEFPCGECAACVAHRPSQLEPCDLAAGAPQFSVSTGRQVARRVYATPHDAPVAILRDAAQPWRPAGGPWNVAQARDVIAALQAWLQRVDPPIGADN